ncbi:hypothetical protein W97_03736 [Coniosporium apollinis CBS 100218]|uniref:Pinin/SDK/MemA protein domain-containing protein n=1 Tax=Coniosporium apollinis (strain CBS 100218) TaxID=1168221 RepID=R7YRM2_CONA1|nr:uncharacterized protein W97_03736 [Coniosporium apollinis CBS 100218]EON64503.1 hypothetical protein W97_03736 [Coniosporium apollinis CBS 100218]
MSEEQPTVASAVVVPDAPEAVSPKASNKRRQSSVSESGSKRPRLSRDRDHEEIRDTAPPPAEDDGRASRRKSGQAEERKRGQRLFGALLGTLSQSSSTAAQKRRADIEKKQQAKLKLQAEEFDQKQKERLDELMRVRRLEQKKFDEQSMRIRHSNLLHMAQFLQTTAEPKIYYKPWELRPEDDARIKSQIEEAQATVDRELDEFEEGRDKERKVNGANSDDAMRVDEELDGPAAQDEPMAAEPPDHRQEPSNDITNETSNENPNGLSHELAAETDGGSTDNKPSTLSEGTEPVESRKTPERENSKDIMDDTNGDVVLEAEEDTVIY